MLHNHTLGDYVTFLRFLKQRRTLDLNNNLHLYNLLCLKLDRCYNIVGASLHELKACHNIDTNVMCMAKNTRIIVMPECLATW